MFVLKCLRHFKYKKCLIKSEVPTYKCTCIRVSVVVSGNMPYKRLQLTKEICLYACISVDHLTAAYTHFHSHILIMGSSVYTSCTTWKICTYVCTCMQADHRPATTWILTQCMCMCLCSLRQTISKSVWNRWLKKQTGNVDDEIPSTNRMYVCT